MGRKSGAKFHLECMDIGVTGSSNRDRLTSLSSVFFFSLLLCLFTIMKHAGRRMAEHPCELRVAGNGDFWRLG